MIRLLFVTDAARVLGSPARPEVSADASGLPADLNKAWLELSEATHVVVDAHCGDHWLDLRDTTVYVLGQEATSAPHIQHLRDATELIERFEDGEDELLVVGGLQTLQRFFPHAGQIDVLETEQSLKGELHFHEWHTPRFALRHTQTWPGGRTLRLQRQPIGLQNAVSLYEEGIRDGQVDVVARYTGARYTQHSTGVKDGVEGFEAFFKEFLIRNPERDIQVLRALQDGPFVFTHASQSLAQGATKWLTMDLFETDPEGHIVEHWDVIEAWTDEVQVSGATQVRGLEDSEHNKARVRGFLTEVLTYNHLDRVEHFVAPHVIVHQPSLAPGRAAWSQALAKAVAIGQRYDFVHRLAGQGDFVVAYSRVKSKDGDRAVFDLFRLQDGMIVEVWGTAEPIVPLEVAENSGKF